MKAKKLKVTSISIVQNHDTPLGLCGYWYTPDEKERKELDERRLNYDKNRKHLDRELGGSHKKYEESYEFVG